jgi:Protein of unknown function (DUF2934)
MPQAIDQRIRQRAYKIWEALGRPDGESDQHWLTAERELAAEAMALLARPMAKAKSNQRKSPRQAKLTRARARKMAVG